MVIIESLAMASLLGFTAFTAGAIVQFIKGNSGLAKINLKYLPFFVLGTIIFTILYSSINPNNSQKAPIATLIALVVVALLFIVVNKGRLDPFSMRHWKFFIKEFTGSGGSFNYHKDWSSVVKITTVYLIIIFLSSPIHSQYKPFVIIGMLIIGTVHALLFSTFQGICPFCKYKVRGIRRRTAAKTCSNCKKRIVIHGSTLIRPRGYRAD